MEAVLHHQWWQILSSNDKDWFIENRHKYGILGSRMCSIIASFLIIYITAMFLGAYINPKIHESATTISCVLCWTFDAILFIKMPKYYDLFAIRKEINLWTIWLFVASSYFIATTAGGLEDQYTFFLWMHGFVYIVETCGFCGFSTLYPRYQMNSVNKTSQNIAEASTSKPSQTAPSGTRADSMWTSWVNLSGDDANWNAFMRQLIKEVK